MRASLGAFVDWRDIVPSREWARIESLIRRHERLAAKIDRCYEAGEVEGIENLEAEAEGIHEKLIGLYHTYAEETEWPAGEGIGIEEYLAVTFAQRDRFASPEDWIENMRDAIRTELLWLGRDVHPTDEQVLEVAQDAYERRRALRERYKKPRKGGTALGDADRPEWRRCGNTMFYETLVPQAPDSAVFVDPINRVLVSWHGQPDAGGPADRVIRLVLPVIPGEVFHFSRPDILRKTISMLQKMTKEVDVFSDFIRQIVFLVDRGEPKEKLIMFFSRGFTEEERTAILRIYVALFAVFSEVIEPEAKTVLRDEIEEALAGFGIIEC